MMTATEESYLNELAAEIAANGGVGDMTLVDAIKAAHTRRQAFAQEMVAGQSKRALMARKALQASVWHRGQEIATKERLAMQARDCVRGVFLACESIDAT